MLICQFSECSVCNSLKLKANKETQNESEDLSCVVFNTLCKAFKSHALIFSEQKRRLKAEKKAQEKAEKLASQPPAPSKTKSNSTKAEAEEEELGDVVILAINQKNYYYFPLQDMQLVYDNSYLPFLIFHH